MSNDDYNKKIQKSPGNVLIWLGVFSFLVILLSFIQTDNITNPWDSELEKFESIISDNSGKTSKEEILNFGNEFVKVQSKFNMHPILNLYSGYYYLTSGNMDSVIHYQTKSLKKIKKDKNPDLFGKSSNLLVNATINRSMQYIAKGDSSSAFKLFVNAVKFVPENSAINNNIADFYVNQNKAEAALYHYYTALKSSSRDTRTLTGLAKAYILRGNIDSCLHYIDATLKINPENKTALELSALIRR